MPASGKSLSMKIKTQFPQSFAAVTGIATTGLCRSLWGFTEATGDVTRAYEQKYQSYSSGQDRFAIVRELTFSQYPVETGDAFVYKDHYNAVVRDQKWRASTPEEYHGIYWDFQFSRVGVASPVRMALLFRPSSPEMNRQASPKKSLPFARRCRGSSVRCTHQT